MNLTHPFLDADGDKLREECGVFGVIGASEAAAVCALGLHALQHRGQEAVGITSFDGAEFYTRRGLGHVADNFSTGESISELPGGWTADRAGSIRSPARSAPVSRPRLGWPRRDPRARRGARSSTASRTFCGRTHGR